MQLIKITFPDDMTEQDKVIIEQRIKIEVRTWVCRVLLAYSMGITIAHFT